MFFLKKKNEELRWQVNSKSSPVCRSPWSMEDIVYLEWPLCRVFQHLCCAAPSAIWAWQCDTKEHLVSWVMSLFFHSLIPNRRNLPGVSWISLSPKIAGPPIIPVYLDLYSNWICNPPKLQLGNKWLRLISSKSSRAFEPSSARKHAWRVAFITEESGVIPRFRK